MQTNSNGKAQAKKKCCLKKRRIKEMLFIKLLICNLFTL